MTLRLLVNPKEWCGQQPGRISMNTQIKYGLVLILLLGFLVTKTEAEAEIVYTFSTPFQASYIDGYYLGEYRDLDQRKKYFFDFAIDSFPDTKEILKLYKKEIYVLGVDGLGIWLPIQAQVFKRIRNDQRSKYGLKFFRRTIGSIEGDQIVVIIDYSLVEDALIEKTLNP
jgi:hypothetical protein